MERLIVTYGLSCEADESPRQKALDIAYEQTVELPEQAVSQELAERIDRQVQLVQRVRRQRITEVERLQGTFEVPADLDPAAAEAVLMAVRSHKTSRRVLVPKSVHPVYRSVVVTTVKNQGIELVELDYDPATGKTVLPSDPGVFAGLVIPQPNFFGVLEDVHALLARALADAPEQTAGTGGVIRHGYDASLAKVVSTRPDCFDAGKAELLASHASRGLEVWLELGLQSSHDATSPFCAAATTTPPSPRGSAAPRRSSGGTASRREPGS